jgi:hypothetical protein
MGGSIVPETDSASHLGGTSKRWAGVWTDEINGYTPITSNGGTISGTLKVSGTGINLNPSNTSKAWIVWDDTNGVCFSMSSTGTKLGISPNDVPHFNGNTLLHTGNYSSYALPLSGGTISNASSYAFKVKVNSSTKNVTIGFMRGDDDTAYLAYHGEGKWSVSSNIILHSGNYSSYALPITGGTIESDSHVPLSLDTTNSQCRIQFKINGSDKALVGWAPTYGSWLYNYASAAYLGIKDDGTPHYSGNTLIHSGNIGSQRVASLIQDKVTDLNSVKVGTFFQSSLNATNLPNGASSYLTGFSLATNNNPIYRVMLGIDLGGNIFARAEHGGNWKDWHQIAFTDSDITGTAAGLKHSNGTVGAVVNESGNVTIGESDLASTTSKLYVNGTARISGAATINGLTTINNNLIVTGDVAVA